jgi:predicted NAD-dependent protein-ADP-ribosyltransferase YbiA (DUF1768 family)
MNKDSIFYFSGSADKPAGMGANERTNNPSKYKDLNNIKNWRKVLSNFHPGQFQWNGKTYNSAEHAFQGAKISIADKTKGNWFCIESGHEIGQSSALIARTNRKLIVLTLDQLNTWENIKSKIMEEILLAKFTQVEIAMRVLLLTQDAELYHGTRGTPVLRQFELENVRAIIRN